MNQPSFKRFIGIDYSGAKTPQASLPGLRIFESDHENWPVEVLPPPGPRKYWSRQGIGQWLVDQFKGPDPLLVGIDHAFSFPLSYFEANRIGLNWHTFLDHFHSHWPVDRAGIKVDTIRRRDEGIDQRLLGNTRWRRLTEKRTVKAKSVFHFDVNGSVAKSTFSGLPWLRYLRQCCGEHIHFWPFDGWQIPQGKSALVEVYPALWTHLFPREGRNAHQHDAYSSAAWMLQRDLDGSLMDFLQPRLTEEDQKAAMVEGWILGVR